MRYLIELTTPYIIDSRIDPNGPYTHAAIVRASDRSNVKIYEVTCVIGYIDENTQEFVMGRASTEDFGWDGRPKLIRDAEYDTCHGATPTANETSGDAIEKSMYQWLLDNGHFAGTLVEI
jgi:hypothetical protein